MPYPLVMINVPRRRVIDLDECGLYMQISNSTIDNAYSDERLLELRQYRKGDKWNVLLAIYGEAAQLGDPSCRRADV